MIKIENYPCNNKLELEEREDIIMCEINSKLNTVRAKRSKKEWRIDNNEKIKEQSKKNYKNNKEKRLEYQKEYHENNKEKRLEQSKKWYENNKEKRLEQVKEYRELNKDKINEKVKCDICGCEITKGSLVRHKKTLKCLNHNK